MIDSTAMFPATLGDVLFQRAAHSAEHLWLHAPERDWTYGQLLDRSLAIAAGLVRAGVERGDVVPLVGMAPVELIGAIFGTWFAGGVPAPLSADVLTGARLAERAATLGASCCLGGAGAPALAAATPVLLALDRLVGEAADVEAVEQRGADPALRLWVDDDGPPRAVELSHLQLHLHTAFWCRAWEVRSTDVGLAGLPLDQPLGLGLALLGLVGGFPVALLPSGSGPLDWLHALDARGVTLTVARTATLVSAARAAAEVDLSALRRLACGDPPACAEPLDRFAEAFDLALDDADEGRRDPRSVGLGRIEHVHWICQRRGLALHEVDADVLERERRAVAPHGGRARVLVGCGRPLAGEVQLQLLADDGSIAVADHVGELTVRGPLLTTVPPDGWLRTGQLCVMHDGELYWIGARSRTIALAGRRIAPEPLEDALLLLEGLTSDGVAVLGPPVTARLLMVLEAAPGADAAALIDAARAIGRRRLGHDPGQVRVVAARELPRSVGRVVRHALAAVHEQLTVVAEWTDD